MLKRFVHISYIICSLLLMFVLLLTVTQLKNDVLEVRPYTGYEILTAYSVHTVEDSSAPVGVRTEYLFHFNDLPENGKTLLFHTKHQNVEVYVNGSCIYRLAPNENNLFGKTPGNDWNTIPVYASDAGADFKIDIIPVYESSLDIEPTFYFGSVLSIWVDLIGKNIITFVLSLVAVFLGILFSLFVFTNYRHSKINKSLLMMGIFSLNIGIWKIADIDATGLLFPHSIALAYLPYFTLFLVCIPFILYVKELFTNKENIFWYLPCFLSIFVILVSVILQLTHVADFRQVLWMNHTVMGSIVVLILLMIIYEIKTAGLHGQLKTTIFGMGCCLIGLIADLMIYYTSHGTSATLLGMLGFTVYISVLGIKSFREARRLMAIGMQAKHFKQMAYHDQLTGLYNRAAYAEYISHSNFNPEDHIVVMLDLNNLKRCNDTQGHEMGDRYITNSATLIEQVFGTVGKCYRMGGDEFCVLLNKISLRECAARVKRLHEEVSRHNQEHPTNFTIQIACGYEAYNKDIDYDLNDTLRRADKMMYHEKFAMKQAHVTPRIDT